MIECAILKRTNDHGKKLLVDQHQRVRLPLQNQLIMDRTPGTMNASKVGV